MCNPTSENLSNRSPSL